MNDERDRVLEGLEASRRAAWRAYYAERDRADGWERSFRELDDEFAVLVNALIESDPAGVSPLGPIRMALRLRMRQERILRVEGDLPPRVARIVAYLDRSLPVRADRRVS